MNPGREADRVLLAHMRDCLDRIFEYTQAERSRFDALQRLGEQVRLLALALDLRGHLRGQCLVHPRQGAAMAMATQVAHMNVARLRHPPGDPRVAGFIDNVTKVNAIAERSPGFVWRFSDEALSVVEGVAYQGLAGDPKLAISLSVWETVEQLWQFVNKSVHGGFVRSRERWFEPYGGPNYVLWSHVLDTPPDISEGWSRLKLLADQGATLQAFDFAFAGMKRDA